MDYRSLSKRAGYQWFNCCSVRLKFFVIAMTRVKRDNNSSRLPPSSGSGASSWKMCRIGIMPSRSLICGFGGRYDKWVYSTLVRKKEYKDVCFVSDGNWNLQYLYRMYFIWHFYRFTSTNSDLGKAKVCGRKSMETCGIVFFDFLSRNIDDGSTSTSKLARTTLNLLILFLIIYF